ncbi:MAG: hypothetical protein WAJ93_16180, partial [Candidatus Nitrosopolaris sp.]
TILYQMLSCYILIEFKNKHCSKRHRYCSSVIAGYSSNNGKPPDLREVLRKVVLPWKTLQESMLLPQWTQVL